MLEKVGLENIIKGKTAAGVEILITPQGTFEINAVVVKKNKSEITIEIKAEGLNNVEQLLNTIGIDTPMVLLINGKGIIHRKTTISETDTPPIILNKILPNANIEEFAIQINKHNDSEAFISIIRIATLNEIIESLEKVTLFTITECLLGPFVVNNVFSFLEEKMIDNNKLFFDTYQLQIKNEQITDISITDKIKQNEKVLIGGEFLSSKLLLPFAAAVSFFTGNKQGILNSNKLNSLKQETQNKQKFEFMKWGILIAMFTVLLCNYFVFNYYWKKSEEINTLFMLNQSALQRYEALKTELDSKRQFLEKNGLLENSFTSKYADELAASLPENIQWLDLNICPMKRNKNNQDEDGFYFEKQLITITGKCKRSADLNDWIKQIKKINWVSSTSLVDYKQDNATEDGVFLINVVFANQ